MSNVANGQGFLGWSAFFCGTPPKPHFGAIRGPSGAGADPKMPFLIPCKNQGSKWVQPNYIVVESWETGKGANLWPRRPLGWQSGGPCHGTLQIY